MLKITDDNYNQFKQIYEILWRYESSLIGIDPDVEYSPINVLSSWEMESKTIAKSGLKEGLRDMLTGMTGLPNDMKTEIDNRLKSKGLISFNQLITVVKDIPVKVLKRGVIKTIDEYYVIKEIISDVANELNNKDRNSLEKLCFKFETVHGDK